MMVLQFFVVLWCFIETKGVSLEEMEKKLKIANERGCCSMTGPERDWDPGTD